MDFKQCIVIRTDLKLSPGKLAVQVAHAAVLALERADNSTISEWKSEGQKKVVLKVANVQELFRLREDAQRAGLPAALVVDAGLTEIPPGTVTCLGIGPGKNVQMDKITGKLSLL
ncbi:MAG TPA: peptidyl-tRNA hydrolase Pth2 [Methanotrichaceae archaeon]|nr:peptidyl-tRNA hydrolase Pth2 [Methanotrichaceae archaeon]